MTHTAFQREWVAIAGRLGLDIALAAEIRLGGRRLVAPVLLRGYGAARGMVLVTDFDDIRDRTDDLVAAGYGYSCLSEPSGRPLDWDAVAEMLEDWGLVG